MRRPMRSVRSHGKLNLDIWKGTFTLTPWKPKLPDLERETGRIYQTASSVPAVPQLCRDLHSGHCRACRLRGERAVGNTLRCQYSRCCRHCGASAAISGHLRRLDEFQRHRSAIQRNAPPASPSPWFRAMESGFLGIAGSRCQQDRSLDHPLQPACSLGSFASGLSDQAQVDEEPGPSRSGRSSVRAKVALAASSACSRQTIDAHRVNGRYNPTLHLAFKIADTLRERRSRYVSLPEHPARHPGERTDSRVNLGTHRSVL